MCAPTRGSLHSALSWAERGSRVYKMQGLGGGGNLPSLGVSPSCQATMAELQKVQITEEKPLLPGQTPEVAKVNRDPPTPRPEVQACSHPPHLLPTQIHDLILTYTPVFSTCAHLSPPYTTVGVRPSSCHCTNLHPLHVSLCHLFLSFVWVGLFACLSLSVSVPPSVILHGCVSLRGSVHVCLSRRLS